MAGNPHDNADPDTTTVDVQINLTVTLSDLDMLDAMQRAGGFLDLSEIAEQALYHYARHLDVGPVPADFMMLRRRLNRRGRPYTKG